jgi:hypothetical protein
MTYRDALERVRLAVAAARDPRTHEANFERTILAILIELEILKIEANVPPPEKHQNLSIRELCADGRRCFGFCESEGYCPAWRNTGGSK